MSTLGTETDPIILHVGDTSPPATRTVTNDDGTPWYVETDVLTARHVYSGGTQEPDIEVTQETEDDPGTFSIPAPTQPITGLVRTTVYCTSEGGAVKSLAEETVWEVRT